QVEIEMAVALAHQEEEARRIGTDFVNHLFQRDELARALAHADRLATTSEADQLHQQHAESTGIATQPCERRRYAHDVTVMLRAPEIDELVEPAAQLLAMIANVAGEIRQLAIAALDDAIFLVTKLLRAKPSCAVALV